MRFGKIGPKRMIPEGGGWANPYVTDGLIAMWDGEWNAGGGVHDPNATRWNDLVRPDHSIKFTLLSGDVWGNDHLLTSQFHNLGGVYGGGWYFEDTGITNTIAGKTFEFVFDVDSVVQAGDHVFSWSTLQSGPFALKNVWSYLRFTGGGNGNYGNDNDSFSLSEFIGKKFAGHFSLDIDGKVLYFNGEPARENFTYEAGSNKSYPLQIGAFGQTVKWKSIRIYDKRLTAAEISANYAVDAARFNLPTA